MKTQELISLIEGDKKKLLKWYNQFHIQSLDIFKWCELLDYPKETHSTKLMSKIRNKVQSGLMIYFDEDFHTNRKELAEIKFQEAIDLLNKGEALRKDWTKLYNKFAKFIYNN